MSWRKRASFGLCWVGSPRGRTSARREVLRAGDGHPRPQGRGRASPPVQAGCASLCPGHGAFAPQRPAGPPRLSRARGPPSGQGGSTAAGGVFASLPAGPAAASASSFAPSAPCNCTARRSAQVPRDEGSPPPCRRQSWPRPRAVWRISRCAREPCGLPTWGREFPGEGSRGTAAAEQQKPPRGSVLPSEGKARRRHPSGWLQLLCPSGTRRGRQSGVRRAGRLAPLPAARGQPRGRTAGRGRGRGGGGGCAPVWRCGRDPARWGRCVFNCFLLLWKLIAAMFYGDPSQRRGKGDAERELHRRCPPEPA